MNSLNYVMNFGRTMIQKTIERKVALITGASRGIGRATAHRFAQEGIRLILNYYKPSDTQYGKEDAIHTLIESLENIGAEVFPYEADVSNREAVRSMVSAGEKHFGEINILVNNAGIGGIADITTLSEETWDRMIAVNLKGQFLVAQAVIPGMKKRKEGKIVNISSELGLVGEAGLTAYCSTKAGIIGFTKALAKELAPDGILVNCVAPGPTDTDMLRPEERTVEMIRSIPLRRLGRDDEIAAAIYFLVSQETSWTTGQVFSPNGGTVI
jgi:3-oxoacyl-[acyl-carrier protein] reductase